MEGRLQERQFHSWRRRNWKGLGNSARFDTRGWLHSRWAPIGTFCIKRNSSDTGLRRSDRQECHVVANGRLWWRGTLSKWEAESWELHEGYQSDGLLYWSIGANVITHSHQWDNKHKHWMTSVFNISLYLLFIPNFVCYRCKRWVAGFRCFHYNTSQFWTA